MSASRAFRRRVALLGAAATAVLVPGPVTTGPAQAALTCRDDLVMNIAAHEDDDILFMNPDIQTGVAAGRCTLTVFVTAGDNGLNPVYWEGREAGARAAAAHMAGVEDDWTREGLRLADGQTVVHDVLVGRPTVGLVFLRLPDGGSGAGFGATGSQSLQRLWQNSITSIDAIDGSARYSRAGVVAALASLMTTFRPVLVRAHDHVGKFGDGDHSDHHGSAFFARAAHDLVTERHRFTGYRGYGVAALAANLTAAQADAKLATFLAYAPHDRFVCQDAAACLASSSGPRFSRQYTVGSELGGLQNAARVGTAKASSQNTTTGQTAAKAVDGVIGGNPVATLNEWATVGGRAGSWLEVTWPGPHTLESVVLYDRPNSSDQVTRGTLLFGDGSTVAVGALRNEGSATVVTFSPRRVTRVRLRVDAVSPTTRNVGLAELQAFTTNVAPRAVVTASSQNTSTGQTAVKAVDGYPLGNPAATTREWATVGGRAGTTLDLTWPVPVRVDRVVLYDRPNANDQVTAGQLTFSSGSAVTVPALPNEGVQKVVTFAPRTITSLRLTVTAVSPTTRNIGLAEIQVQTG